MPRTICCIFDAYFASFLTLLVLLPVSKAKINGVFSEYMAPVGNGFVEYAANFPKALEKLKEAGIDKYVAEYQKQFSEWHAQQ
ncbi:DUF3502 domain-containing protein [Cohnella massiliensis]|uniref:DUF3502 domain-containing protein n=1 Tax=Cohnella massiliensis TaxID=1816691 RepID=UPI00111A9D16|nr:DUF3502 domain-containing protein [Cohnella massiliensis]